MHQTEKSAVNISCEERRSRIARLLLDKGRVRIGELSRLFDVSGETIRKDLIELEKKGVARKSHGGAVVAYAQAGPKRSNPEGLLYIAEKALEYIEAQSVVFLDDAQPCELLAHRLVYKQDIQIVTASLAIAEICSGKGIQTFLLGGELRDGATSTGGFWAMQYLAQVRLYAAFLYTCGFAQHGPCASTMEEAQLKRTVVDNASKKYVLCEGGNAGCDGFVAYAGWEDADLLITDSGLRTDALTALQGRVDVVIAY